MERRVVSQDGNGPPGAEVIPAETANRRVVDDVGRVVPVRETGDERSRVG
jgi:hypothetical protein